MLALRPATREDFVAFYGTAPPITVRAMVAANGDGEVMGIGGYYLNGDVALAFTEYRKPMSKKDMIRCAQIFVGWLKATGLEIIAMVKGEQAERTARHFGFAPDGPVWRMR